MQNVIGTSFSWWPEINNENPLKKTIGKIGCFLSRSQIWLYTKNTGKNNTYMSYSSTNSYFTRLTYTGEKTCPECMDLLFCDCQFYETSCKTKLETDPITVRYDFLFALNSNWKTRMNWQIGKIIFICSTDLSFLCNCLQTYII